MQSPASPPPAASRRLSPKLVLTAVILLILAFAAGHVPQRLRANRLDETLRATNVDLELANLHRDLGIAALEAQRQNFANAATAAAAFFDGCSRLAGDERLASEPRTRGALSAYAASRDEIAVQLGTSDPQVTQRLASLYFTMEGVLARRQ